MTLNVKLFYFMWAFGLFTIVYSWFAHTDITIPLLTTIMAMIGIIGGEVIKK